MIYFTMERKCAQCNKKLNDSKQGTAKYCSDACKMKAYRRREEPVGPALGVVVEPFAATLFASSWLFLAYKFDGESCLVELIVDGVIYGCTIKAFAVKSAMIALVEEAFAKRRLSRTMTEIHDEVVTNRIIVHFNSAHHPFKKVGNTCVTSAVTLEENS